MKNIYFHIGLHKTGTTTLQEHYFPKNPEINLLTTLIPEVKKFIEYISKKDPIHFDKKTAKDLIIKEMNQNKINLISNESLSGPPFAGGYEYGLDHRSPIIENLYNLFPEAKIIIVLRRQNDLAKSFYRQYLKKGGTRDIKRFYGMEQEDRPPIMSLDRFLFSPYIDLIINKFRIENVLILVYEEFRENPKKFLDKLNQFLRVSSIQIELKRYNQTKFGPIGLEITRILNFFMRSHLNPSGFFPPIPIIRNGKVVKTNLMEIIQDKWPYSRPSVNKNAKLQLVTDQILENSKKDNQKLDEEYNLGLKKYLYY